MQISEYLKGRWLELYSPLPVEDVASCIQAASGSFFWYFSHPVARGTWAVRLRFNYVRHPFSYNAKPVMDVRLKEKAGGTAITLVFGAPSMAKVILFGLGLIWLLFLGLVLFALLSGEPQNLQWSDALLLAAAPLLPFAIHKVGTRNANRDFERVVELLRTKASAKPA